MEQDGWTPGGQASLSQLELCPNLCSGKRRALHSRRDTKALGSAEKVVSEQICSLWSWSVLRLSVSAAS